MSKYLQDPDYLFALLTILVKKSGGKIRITEKEMQDISKGDLIGMYYEPETSTIVLKEVDVSDMLKHCEALAAEYTRTYDGPSPPTPPEEEDPNETNTTNDDDDCNEEGEEEERRGGLGGGASTYADVD